MFEVETGRLFAGIKRPLAESIQKLRPHFTEVNRAWRNLLASLPLARYQVEALAGLVLHANANELQGGKFAAYKGNITRQTRCLMEKEVPAEYAIAALTFYF